MGNTGRASIRLLASLLLLHPVHAVIRDNGLGFNQQQLFVSTQENTPVLADDISKQYFVKTNGKKYKVRNDASKAGGTVVHEFDDLGTSVVSFDNYTDASMFAALGYEGDMEADVPRFPMRIGIPKAGKGNLDNDYIENSLTVLQVFGDEVVPYGVNTIFQNTLPDPSYYPSKTAVTPICIIDSGIKTTHPDLSDVVVTAADPNQVNKISDTCSHGTHVAGTIVAEDNAIGVLGIFPGASVKVVKVFDGTDCGWTYSSSLVAAVNKCASSGAKIISMSLGGTASSTTEQNTFASLRKKGILSFAAAGNTGNTELNYPASYSSVISVAAVDQANNKASFSNYNSQVDIAAPGVSVLSTVITNKLYFASSGNAGYVMTTIEYSVAPSTDISAKACQCTSTSCPTTCSGRICIMPRGDTTFANKGNECVARGGVAVIIYNNAQGYFSGTLGSPGAVSIPMFGTSDTYGAAMVGVGTDVDFLIDSNAQPYDFYDGTSMATPHVSGATFLLWNKYPSCTAEQIFAAIMNTALDLGTTGRDNSYGYGLIQYWSAESYLKQPGGCAGSPMSPTPAAATPGEPAPTMATVTKPTSTSCVRRGGSCANGKTCCSGLRCHNNKKCK